MLYLIDTSTLITSARMHYEFLRVPEYWSWLVYMASKDNVKITKECYQEIMQGSEDDHLRKWVHENQAILRYNLEADFSAVKEVVTKGYAQDLTETELGTIDNDARLIAYAYQRTDITIVTNEVSKSTKTRANRRIPDVCKIFSINCCNQYQMNKDLDFKTNWKSR